MLSLIYQLGCMLFVLSLRTKDSGMFSAAFQVLS